MKEQPHGQGEEIIAQAGVNAMVEKYEAGVRLAERALAKHRESLAWGFAFGHGCSYAPNEPIYGGIRAMDRRLTGYLDEQRALLAEFKIESGE